MIETRADIVVIGAGVVGLAIALRLARAGRGVVVLDPEAPGSGASHGNAGTIADYAVMPVGTPGVLRDLPRLMFDRDSPLAIRRAAVLTLAPWLVRFAWAARPAAARRSAEALAVLLDGAAARWETLAADVGAAALIRRDGALYVYRSVGAFRAAQVDLAYRRTLGVAVDLVGPEAVAALEPGMPPVVGGAYFPGAVSLADPGQMMAALASAAEAAGVRFARAQVTGLARGPGGVRVTGGGVALTAARVVIAAGARSRALARMAGDRVPLDTERGYHLEWDMAEPRLSRPVCPTDLGFYLCPMAGRLRAAGTVELGGVDAPPSPHRLAALEAGVRQVFPDLPAPDRHWMGLRPSMPDSLPVIGPSRAGAEVIHAYGHGHIGLTLAPVTAEIVAELVSGLAPRVGIAPYLPSRF